jgi:hypothetical protein
MGFEKNIYQKQHQLLIDTRLRAEIKYKELISEYIKLGKLGLGANAYMNLMCVGEILGYPKSKINEDLSKELEKNGTSIKDNS